MKESLFRVNKHVICSSFSYIPFIFVLVTKSINTGIVGINSITLLSRNTAVISGDEAGIRKVKSYNFQAGAGLCSLNLDDAYGVAGVKMGGNLALAVARRLVKRDMGFMTAILLSSKVNII